MGRPSVSKLRVVLYAALDRYAGKIFKDQRKVLGCGESYDVDVRLQAAITAAATPWQIEDRVRGQLTIDHDVPVRTLIACKTVNLLAFFLEHIPEHQRLQVCQLAAVHFRQDETLGVSSENLVAADELLQAMRKSGPLKDRAGAVRWQTTSEGD